MTDKEKLDALINHIKSAERYQIKLKEKGLEDTITPLGVIYDITSFIEYNLGIQMGDDDDE